MSSNLRVIGFTGRKRSGKDTAAKALCDIGWHRVGFADALKVGALAIDPLCGKHRLSELVELCGWDEAKKNPELRRFLQRYGTEGGRDIFGEDCWVKLAREKVNRSMMIAKGAVIPDVRFANEVSMIHEFGGIVVLIQRPSLEGQIDEHRSEQLDFQPDATILNNGTPEQLHEMVWHLVNSRVHA